MTCSICGSEAGGLSTGAVGAERSLLAGVVMAGSFKTKACLQLGHFAFFPSRLLSRSLSFFLQ
ncbi:MAG TPA: hypothetical protein DDZ90_04240 [Planctomycetaceae bacterium]|nr:hypothetical protein [Planctomycetaceae bacterium]